MPTRCKRSSDGTMMRRCKLSGACVARQQHRPVDADGKRFRCEKGFRQCLDRKCYSTTKHMPAQKIQALFRGHTKRKQLRPVVAAASPVASPVVVAAKPKRKRRNPLEELMREAEDFGKLTRRQRRGSAK